MKNIVSVIAFTLFLVLSGSGQELSPLHIDNFVVKDTENRSIILNGVVTITHNDDQVQFYTPADYERIAALSVNYQSIRLYSSLIGADGTPASQEVYAQLDQMIEDAANAGIYTSIKLDIYEGEIAYNWASLWQNEDDYKEALLAGWQSVWERYIDNPAVIGYDLINEPEQGSLVTETDSVFVCDYLNPTYQFLIDRLQVMDPEKFALFQPSLDIFDQEINQVVYDEYSCPIARENVIYAPHYYTDLDYPYQYSNYRYWHERFVAEATMHQTPLLAGEFGIPWDSAFDGDSTRELEYRRVEFHTIDQIAYRSVGSSRPYFADDNAALSPTLNWSMVKGTEGLGGEFRNIITDGLYHPYPKAIAGDLTSYNLSHYEGMFGGYLFVEFERDTTAGKTKIFTAKSLFPGLKMAISYGAEGGGCYFFNETNHHFYAKYREAVDHENNFEWLPDEEVILIDDWGEPGPTYLILEFGHDPCEPFSVERDRHSHFTSYPNPVSTTFTIDFGEFRRMKLELYDILGRRIELRQISSDKAIFDLSGRPAGIYFIKFDDGTVQKIIKQ